MDIAVRVESMVPSPRRGRRYGITASDRRLQPIIRTLYDRGQLTGEQYATALRLQELYKADRLLANWPKLMKRVGLHQCSILSSIVIHDESLRDVSAFWGFDVMPVLRHALDVAMAIHWRGGVA